MSATDTHDRETFVPAGEHPLGTPGPDAEDLGIAERLDAIDAKLEALLQFADEASQAIDTINGLGGGSPMAMISGLMRAMRDAPEPEPEDG